jgi:hypothetical protein
MSGALTFAERRDPSARADEAFDVTIANEFAVVRARRSSSRNGDRLELTSVRSGYSVRLDATTLEALTWQSPSDFSELVSAFLWSDAVIQPQGRMRE